MFSYIASLKSINFYKALDSSLYFQAFGNTLAGQFLKITCNNEATNFMGIHFSPILGLIAPLYWLFPSAFTVKNICQKL